MKCQPISTPQPRHNPIKTARLAFSRSNIFIYTALKKSEITISLFCFSLAQSLGSEENPKPLIHMLYQRVKGCYDILPESDELWKESHIWQFVEEKMRALAKLYAFAEVRTPVFEYTDVFTRSAGEESDIVSKEMYTFLDKGERSLSLRPEITASLIRAFNESSLPQSKYQRFFYIGPCFRYDRAQKGRYRQFSQFGVEIIGQNDPLIDVETILMLLQLYQSLGIKRSKLLINCIGDKETRAAYAKALKEYFKPHLHELSEDSKRRFETNPLRILDSKDPKDKEVGKSAPPMETFLSSPSAKRFEQVLLALKSSGVDYNVDPTLVRGLDYYCDTVFEVVRSDDSAAQSTIGAGGRYDGLIEQMGGNKLGGIGFATGIERIIQSMLHENVDFLKKEGPTFYFIPLSEEAKSYAFSLMQQARSEGISALLHEKNYNIKKGLQMADALASEFAIIIGDEELSKKTVRVKHLFSRFEGEFFPSDLSHPNTTLKGIL